MHSNQLYACKHVLQSDDFRHVKLTNGSCFVLEAATTSCPTTTESQETTTEGRPTTTSV